MLYENMKLWTYLVYWFLFIPNRFFFLNLSWQLFLCIDLPQIVLDNTGFNSEKFNDYNDVNKLYTYMHC